MRIRTGGWAPRRPRITSTPDRSGSCRSRTTTSGRIAAATRTACAPSLTAAPTSYPASVRSRATPSRHIGWSSTTITRTVTFVTITSSRAGGPGYPQLDLGPLAGRRNDRHVAAEVRHAPPDRLGDAEPPGRRRLVEAPGLDPRPVVADRHGHRLRVVLHEDPGAGVRAAVVTDVG